MRYLEDFAKKDSDKPFFIQCSFPDPHHPFTPPGRYWDMYDPDRIALPSSFDKGTIAPLQWMRDQLARGTADRTGPTAPFAVTAEEARTIIALTYGMIAMVDDAVGDILATLDRLNLSDNTIVIFTADHGDFMGDHGIMLKYLLHYQGLIRVPCIVADPAASEAGTVRTDLAGTIDIAPTILGRAGIQPFNGIQGRDLLDSAAAAPDGLVIEEDTAFRLLGMETPDRVRSLVTDRWRLSYHQAGDWWELYDLAEDPDEIVNLWDSPNRPAVADELVRQMLSRLVALNDTSPLPTGRA
jgi:arylsulfatase A-like enzyme